jgi:hypothetical protein
VRTENDASIRISQLKGSKNWVSCMRLGSGLANWKCGAAQR